MCAAAWAALIDLDAFELSRLLLFVFPLRWVALDGSSGGSMRVGITDIACMLCMVLEEVDSFPRADS